MERSDYKLLPLVALGLGKYVLETALSYLPKIPSQEEIDEHIKAVAEPLLGEVYGD